MREAIIISLTAAAGVESPTISIYINEKHSPFNWRNVSVTYSILIQ
jgi:hypothetical protein